MCILSVDPRCILQRPLFHDLQTLSSFHFVWRCATTQHWSMISLGISGDYMVIVSLNHTFFKTDFPWTKPSSYWGSHDYGRCGDHPPTCAHRNEGRFDLLALGRCRFMTSKMWRWLLWGKPWGNNCDNLGPLYLRLHLEPQAGYNFSLKQNFKLNRVSGKKKRPAGWFPYSSSFSNFGWEDHRHKETQSNISKRKNCYVKWFHLGIFH